MSFNVRYLLLVGYTSSSSSLLLFHFRLKFNFFVAGHCWARLILIQILLWHSANFFTRFCCCLVVWCKCVRARFYLLLLLLEKIVFGQIGFLCAVFFFISRAAISSDAHTYNHMDSNGLIYLYNDWRLKIIICRFSFFFCFAAKRTNNVHLFIFFVLLFSSSLSCFYLSVFVFLQDNRV